MLPLENTTSGSINEVYDLLQHTSLSLVGELAYPIKHCVLVNEQDYVSKIDTLYSHPQFIQQCSQFIQSLERVHIEYCESSSHAIDVYKRQVLKLVHQKLLLLLGKCFLMA